jgi:hypothetical protein
MANSFSTILTPTGTFQKTCASRPCEPYVLLTSIDLRPARPEVEAFLYGPWQTTNSENTADIVPLVWREDFWKLDIITPPIAKPDDVIFLIALMEHFDGDPSSLRLMIKKAVIGALDAPAYHARETRSARLIDRVNRAVDRANGGPNFSSTIEIMLTAADLIHIKKNSFCRFVRFFCGYGGHYCLNFELFKAESDLWNLVSQKDDAFACAAE